MQRSKWVRVRPIGRKRVAQCIMRFGWNLDDATKRTQTTITDWYEEGTNNYVKTTSSTKRWVELSFYRDSRWFSNLAVLLIPELLFNIAFLLRRIIGFLLPLVIPAAILIILLGGGQEGWALNRSAVQLLGLCVHIPFLGFRTSWSMEGGWLTSKKEKSITEC